MNQSYTYNNLVRIYNRTKRKLQNLTMLGRNLRKQGILRKRIVRLFKALSNLHSVIKLGAGTVALCTGMFLFQPNTAQAQITFGPLQSNPFGLIDIGYNSSPEFADLDNDGDQDMITDDGGYDGFTDFVYFENTGTPATSVFTTVVYNPFSLTGGSSSPTLADLDDDGDMDLMTIYFSGGIYKFKFFQNTGTAVIPAFATFTLNPFGLTGEGGSPTFVDLDNDGDFDLMMGAQEGNFKYFENTGTATAPAFDPLLLNPFGLADIGYNSQPAFADLDSDGDLDMISGECQYYWYNSNFKYFQNIGTMAAPLFDVAVANPFGFWTGAFGDPAFVDLDTDGDLDFMAGEFYGDFTFFENITPCIPSTELCNSLDDNCNGLIDDGIAETISIMAGGATTFCSGGSVVLTATYSGTSVQWKRNGNNIPGATSANYTATAKGTYTCETSSLCDTELSTGILVTVNKLPTATITAGGSTTFCTGGSVVLTANAGGGLTYQWYKSASAIAGATTINYTATLAGTYRCKVTKTITGCEKISNSIVVAVPCREVELLENQVDNKLLIYPNPAKEEITVSFEKQITSSLLIITDVTGQVVSENNIMDAQITIDISNYSSGMYFIKVELNGKEYVEKFIKE